MFIKEDSEKLRRMWLDNCQQVHLSTTKEKLLNDRWYFQVGITDNSNLSEKKIVPCLSQL